MREFVYTSAETSKEVVQAPDFQPDTINQLSIKCCKNKEVAIVFWDEDLGSIQFMPHFWL